MPSDRTKDSGIEWVGRIPASWDVLDLIWCCAERKEKNTGNAESNVLSLSYGNIIVRDVDSNMGLLPDSFDTYQIVEPSNIVLRLTDLQNDKRSLRVGLAKERGIITSAYVCLDVGTRLDPRFAYALLHSYDVTKVFYGYGGGVRQSMKYDDLKHVPLVVPPLPTQKAIADYLDAKTAAIDALIEKKRKLLDLLAEERAALINQAVTKGLDPSVPMKDSGIPWIGEIPAHWQVLRGRFLYRQLQLPANPDEGVVTAFRDGQVTLRENRRTDGFTLAIKEVGYQGVRRGDLVIHSMDAFAGAIGVSESFGKCTGEYVVCEAKDPRHSNSYYAALLRWMAKQNYIFVICPSVRERAPRFRFAKFKDVLLPVPPSAEQHAIISQLEDSSKGLVETFGSLDSQIDRLQEYRQALITAAVTGQLDIEAAA